MFSIKGSRKQSEGVECPFGILTAKWQLFKKAVEMNVSKAARIVRCICVLHNIRTTWDPSFLQETLQILGSCHTTISVSS
jgi:hypothetical protein